MAVGNWTWFDIAVEKFSRGTIDLDSHAFKQVLLTSSQALTKTFTGTSTDCRYSDLTAELATANGYTNGGLALTSPTLTRIGSTVTWTTADASWTLSGSLTFKYAAIFDNTNANKDLLCFCDLDNSGGSVIASVSPLVFVNSGGILRMIAP